MPEPTQPPDKKRVSTTALVILCGLLLLLSLAAAVIFPVVREVRFIERMESEGFELNDAERTTFSWGPFDRLNRSVVGIFGSDRPNALPSLRPIRNSPTLEIIFLEKTTMTQDHLTQLGRLENLTTFRMNGQVTPEFATSLPRHFPNLRQLEIPLHSENLEALSRNPVRWRQNISHIKIQPSSVLEGSNVETLLEVF